LRTVIISVVLVTAAWSAGKYLEVWLATIGIERHIVAEWTTRPCNQDKPRLSVSETRNVNLVRGEAGPVLASGMYSINTRHHLVFSFDGKEYLYEMSNDGSTLDYITYDTTEPELPLPDNQGVWGFTLEKCPGREVP